MNVYKLNKHKTILCIAENVNSTLPDMFSAFGYDRYNMPPIIGYDRCIISFIIIDDDVVDDDDNDDDIEDINNKANMLFFWSTHG